MFFELSFVCGFEMGWCYSFGSVIKGVRWVMKKGATYSTYPNDLYLVFVNGNHPASNIANGNPKYRYGFNGKKKDDVEKGQGNSKDYGMRIYDPRSGRFLSVDPFVTKFAELTPYQFASNSPIENDDLDGLEVNNKTQ